MSWHKITLPFRSDIDPRVVEIGDLARSIYERENRPAGFAMVHAARGDGSELNDTRLIYFSPVAAELCRSELPEHYTLEPCDVPARDEPMAAWVFGDPLVRNWLKEKWEPEAEETTEAQTVN